MVHNESGEHLKVSESKVAFITAVLLSPHKNLVP